MEEYAGVQRDRIYRYIVWAHRTVLHTTMSLSYLFSTLAPSTSRPFHISLHSSTLLRTCSKLSRAAPGCSRLLQASPYLPTLLHIAPDFPVLLRTFPHCSRLLYFAPYCSALAPSCSKILHQSQINGHQVLQSEGTTHKLRPSPSHSDITPSRSAPPSHSVTLRRSSTPFSSGIPTYLRIFNRSSIYRDMVENVKYFLIS